MKHTTIIMILKFLFYGLIGWSGEIIFTGAGSLLIGSLKLSGHTYLWMFPIYGLAVFLEPVHKRIRSLPWIIRGTILAGIILLAEYLCGWMLRFTIGICPWDYSLASRYMVDGLIRLDYFPVWFMTGLLFEKINNFINRIQISYSLAGNLNEDQNAMIILLKDGQDFLASSLTLRRSKRFITTMFRND